MHEVDNLKIINYKFLKSSLLPCPLFQPLSFLPIQVVNAISTFGNDRKYICSPGANDDCQLANLSYFYLVIVLLPFNMVNIVTLVRTCLGTHIMQAVQYAYG